MNAQKWFWNRWTLLAFGVLLVAIAWGGRRPYHLYKERHSLKQAQSFLASKDYRNAFLSVKQCLTINPSNAPACLVMAELAELSRSPAALDWRRRLVELQPTVENKLALARAGVRFEKPPFPAAQEVLFNLPASATNLLPYQQVALELALKLNDFPAAQAHLEAASRLDPTNKSFILNLSVLRLSSTNVGIATAARSTLESFCLDTNLASVALRSLVTDRLARNDLAGAQKFSKQLLATAQANTADRLQDLSILQKAENPELIPQLKSLQERSSTNGAAAADVATWMMTHDLRLGAFQWMTNLPPSIASQGPLRLALANYFVAESDWDGLRSFTSHGDWGQVDFLRSAFLSHAWFELGDEFVASSVWKTAISNAGKRYSALLALFNLARNWQMTPACEDLLARICKEFPGETWAWRELERRYFSAGKTSRLKQIYTQRLAFSPKDVSLKNNVAATSLLLNDDLPRAHRLAKEVYDQRPEDAVVVSTYAYSLHLQGRTQEGLAVLDKLKPQSLEAPAAALYYGVLLSALHETNRATQFLKIAAKADPLLPEEKRLLTSAAENAELRLKE
ncbi:MAG: hypothetical protein ACTHLW_14650 [Verrucomicrobiota bacterium]